MPYLLFPCRVLVVTGNLECGLLIIRAAFPSGFHGFPGLRKAAISLKLAHGSATRALASGTWAPRPWPACSCPQAVPAQGPQDGSAGQLGVQTGARLLQNTPSRDIKSRKNRRVGGGLRLQLPEEGLGWASGTWPPAGPRTQLPPVPWPQEG